MFVFKFVHFVLWLWQTNRLVMVVFLFAIESGAWDVADGSWTARWTVKLRLRSLFEPGACTEWLGLAANSHNISVIWYHNIDLKQCHLTCGLHRGLVLSQNIKSGLGKLEQIRNIHHSVPCFCAAVHRQVKMDGYFKKKRFPTWNLN